MKINQFFNNVVIIIIISIVFTLNGFSHTSSGKVIAQNVLEQKLITSTNLSEPIDHLKPDFYENISGDSTSVEKDLNNDNGADIDNALTEYKNLTQEDPVLTILNSASYNEQLYLPEELLVNKGEVITIINTDHNPHTVTSDTHQPDLSKSYIDTGVMLPGSNATIDTKKLVTGKYSYHCEIHPFMTGLIVIK